MKVIRLFFILILGSTCVGVSYAAENDEGKGTSGLPLPRFASLRSDDVNMRTGPGTRYPIEWVFKHQGLPVEITAEYEIWRRVRDPEGAEGWVHKTELSGKRAAIVTGKPIDLVSEPSDTAIVMAHLDVGAVGQITSCAKDWCKLKFDDVKGYLRKTSFWGAYPGEILE